MTLTEMAVVVGIIALMVGLTLPVANMLYNSYEAQCGVKAMINSALASARAIAIKEQRYAGIRFQKRYDPAGVLNASQYIIFIINEKNRDFANNITNGFRAVDGIQPIKLPDSIGVMDLMVRTDWTNPGVSGINSQPIDDNSKIDTPEKITDTTSFSIIFSPSGKLVIHAVRVRNRDGQTSGTPPQSNDDTFNTLVKITDPVSPAGMFLQDDYAERGLGSEMSRNNFIIYETKKLKQVPSNNRWDGYLKYLKPVYISPYTGTIIE